MPPWSEHRVGPQSGQFEGRIRGEPVKKWLDHIAELDSQTIRLPKRHQSRDPLRETENHTR